MKQLFIIIVVMNVLFILARIFGSSKIKQKIGNFIRKICDEQ